MNNSKKPRIFYGWFVLVGAFVIASIGYSMRYSFSVFYPEILNEFGWSRAETAAAFSVNLLVYGISSPFVGALTDRFGPRRVLVFGACILAAGLLAMNQMNNIWLFYFLLGIVIAVGINSLGFAVHTAYLPNWFVRRRGLAFGVLMASAGAGNVLVLLYQSLISALGWRLAYMMLAAITVGIVVPLVIFFIRRTPQEKGLLPDGDAAILTGEEVDADMGNKPALLVVNKEWAATKWTLVKAMRTYRLWLMFLMYLSFSMGINLVWAHQPIYCQDIGFSAMFAASIYGLSGAITVIGNLFGFISDRIGREAAYTLGVLGPIIGVGALILASVSQPWLLYLYAIVWGILFGMGNPAVFSALADLFAGKHFGAINGFCLLGFGIGGAIGPWLGGYIFDVMGSYTLAFIIAMVVLGLSSILLWLAAPRRVRLVPGRVSKTITLSAAS